MLTQRRVRRFPFIPALVGIGVLLYLAYHVHTVLIPFVLSAALAYLVNPLINIGEARGLKREHIVVLLYIIIAATITLTANFIVPMVARELSLLQNQAPAYFSRSQQYLSDLQVKLAHHAPFAQGLIEHWSLRMYNPLIEHVEHLPSYLLGLFPLLSLIFLVPFISFFMLMDSSVALQRIIQQTPSRFVEQALHLISEVDTALGNYVRGIIIEALAIAVASFAGLVFLGLNYALAIATLAGVSNVIPYIGPIVGAVVGAFVALSQFKTMGAVAKVLLLFGGIRLADDLLLQPIISKHSVHLHPLIYLLAIMVGGEAFGFIGLLLGVPAACVLKALIQVSWDWYASETMIHPPRSYDSLRIPYV